MKFEYDKAKSRANSQKHSISLEEATKLWSLRSVEIEARFAGEERRMIIGKLDHKFYSCIFTVRGDNIRLISARRSHSSEEGVYNEKIQEDH